MYSSLISILLLNYTFVQAKFAPAGPELDLVLRQIGDFDFDLIKVEDQGHEEVAFLRRRASPGEDLDTEKDCKDDDCAQYRAWEDEEWEEEGIGEDEEISEEGVVGERDALEDITIRNVNSDDPLTHSLSRRGKRDACICKNTIIDGKEEAEPCLKVALQSYPGLGAKGITSLEKVYDFADYSQPNHMDWFTLKNIKKQTPGRKYSVEHILEWQMFLNFLQSKKGRTNKENENQKTQDNEDEEEVEEGDSNNICTMLHMYWKNDISFEVKHPKLINGKWEMSPDESTKLTKNPLIYVADHFPGGPKKSPYSNEFVVLESAMNGKKANLWAGQGLSSLLEVFQNGAPSEAKTNWQTMQFNIEHNRWWDSTQPNGKQHKEAVDQENQGRCAAIKKFRDVLGVYKYHQDEHVKKIMKTQVERIAQAFKTMDEDILPKQPVSESSDNPRPPYTPIGLADKWLRFMDEVYDARILKIEQWMEKWAEKLEALKDGNYDEIKGLGKIFQKRAPDWTNQCGVARDDEVVERIKLLLEAYNGRGKMENPLKSEDIEMGEGDS